MRLTGRCWAWTREYALLPDPLIEQLALHEDTQQLVYRRGPLVFAFNFHPTRSPIQTCAIPVPDAADYQVILNTDDAAVRRAWARGAEASSIPASPCRCTGASQSIQIYLPSRSAQVLAPVE